MVCASASDVMRSRVHSWAPRASPLTGGPTPMMFNKGGGVAMVCAVKNIQLEFLCKSFVRGAGLCG